MRSKFLLGLLALLAAGQMACVDPLTGEGATGDTALYVHSLESGTAKIQVYTDVTALHASTTSVTPNRTLTTTLLDKVKTLAWGGMALDSSHNILYLVGETGTVVRISRLRAQTGDIPSSSQDAVSFELGQSSERLAGGKFRQATVDPSSGVLYVAETNDSDCQVWVVASASSQPKDSVVAKVTVSLGTGDKGCTGLSAGQTGELYGFFREGGQVGFPDPLTGPRVRKGTGSAFHSQVNTVLGSSTQLGIYGSLAYDTGNKQLYVARHLTDSGMTGAPVLVFTDGSFSTGLNQAPSRTLGASAEQANLRVIAHAGKKDWLGGLRSDSEGGTNALYLWKNPSSGGSAVNLTLSPGSVVRGLAFDGNN